MNNTFKLSDLNQNFWDKVIFIQVCHSSGMGGPGVIWIITNEHKLYVIGITELPFNEWTDLEKLTPLLDVINLPNEVEAYKAETVGYKYSNLGYVLIKEEYFDQYEEMWKLVYDMDQYKIHYVHEPDVMKLVLGCEDMERLDLEDTVERIEREKQEYDRLEKEHNARKLTADYLDWKPIYDNNDFSGVFRENGIYCLLLRDVGGIAEGLRISIEYQVEEIEPFGRYSNAPIEQYILYEKNYGRIDGKLSFRNPEDTHKVSSYSFMKDTLNDYDLNNPGTFIRAFETLEEAKEYAIAVADRANYNKDNVIDVSDTEKIKKFELNNMRIKYQAILTFGKYYQEIINLVATYEFPDKNVSGGWYIIKEMVEKLGIDEETAERMMEYLPQILLPRYQRKAKEILESMTE